MAGTNASSGADHSNETLPARLQRVFGASSDGVVVTDEAGLVVYVNAALEEVSGYDEQELLGEVVEKLVPRGERAEHDAAHRRYRDAPSCKDD